MTYSQRSTLHSYRRRPLTPALSPDSVGGEGAEASPPEIQTRERTKGEALLP